MNELTIVIPVYNEAGNIKTAIDWIEEQVLLPHEIAIVYDRDEDTTVPVVREIKYKLCNIQKIAIPSRKRIQVPLPWAYGMHRKV
ncbi:MAG: glycosyltransferase [Bacteroidales bacterium]|jgi:glycosyltransferase involved in cell wall biosynthesis|nr:glycosyltransferase [Bacteroidales bacterium]